MPIAIADQFKGLPMGDLIGGPLSAACDAQVRLANATADFIKVVGFLPPPKGTQGDQKDRGDVRTVLFRFDRPAQPPASVTNADSTSKDSKEIKIPTEQVELDIPLLAIVKIPTLCIKTVDIVFDMEVKNSEHQSEETDYKAGLEAEAKLGWGPVSGSIKISGSVSSHKENTRQTDQSAKYHVEVHAEDTGMPEGLARVLDIINTSVAPRTIVPPPSSTG